MKSWSDTLSGPPAILGGEPAFPQGLPLSRPSIPDLGRVGADLERILSSGMLTAQTYVRSLEERAAAYLGVAHCVAVSSCTTGLILLLQSLGLKGEVIVPSFTFPATVHPVVWNRLRPVFADVDPDTLTLSPDAARRAATEQTGGLLATHIFGTPCDVEGLQALADDLGVPLLFDAAHAFGSRHRGVPVGGFGKAEVFSLTPTKLLVASEGGLIATDDDDLAQDLRVGREYGNPGDYDVVTIGLNARLSEIHAAIALASLDDLEERIARRNHLATVYLDALSGVPGLAFPAVHEYDRTTYKDFTVLVDPAEFGMDARELARALAAEGIDTRHYYSPPVHRMRAYSDIAPQDLVLPVTEDAADKVLTLPLYESMPDGAPARVAAATARVQVKGGT